MARLQPARSCFTCFYGGTERSPDCKLASDRLCCEEWIEPKDVRVKATVEFSIDLREISEYFQEEMPKIYPEKLSRWFQDIFRQSLPEYLEQRITIDDDLQAVHLIKINDVEIQYDTEEEFRTAVTASQGVVFV